MTNSQTKFSPRFIHMPRTFISKGATIAYVRDDSHVYFAWSKVSPTDNYDKSIGRKISSERLEKALQTMMSHSELTPNETFLYLDSNVGYLSSAQLVARETYVSVVIADHMLAKLTPMDFKHSYITNVVSSLVFDRLT